MENLRKTQGCGLRVAQVLANVAVIVCSVRLVSLWKTGRDATAD
jgi:hypothetical protein